MGSGIARNDPDQRRDREVQGYERKRNILRQVIAERLFRPLGDPGRIMISVASCILTLRSLLLASLNEMKRARETPGPLLLRQCHPVLSRRPWIDDFRSHGPIRKSNTFVTIIKDLLPASQNTCCSSPLLTSCSFVIKLLSRALPPLPSTGMAYALNEVDAN